MISDFQLKVLIQKYKSALCQTFNKEILTLNRFIQRFYTQGLDLELPAYLDKDENKI